MIWTDFDALRIILYSIPVQIAAQVKLFLTFTFHNFDLLSLEVKNVKVNLYDILKYMYTLYTVDSCYNDPPLSGNMSYKEQFVGNSFDF